MNELASSLIYSTVPFGTDAASKLHVSGWHLVNTRSADWQISSQGPRIRGLVVVSRGTYGAGNFDERCFEFPAVAVQLADADAGASVAIQFVSSDATRGMQGHVVSCPEGEPMASANLRTRDLHALAKAKEARAQAVRDAAAAREKAANDAAVAAAMIETKRLAAIAKIEDARAKREADKIAAREAKEQREADAKAAREAKAARAAAAKMPAQSALTPEVAVRAPLQSTPVAGDGAQDSEFQDAAMGVAFRFLPGAKMVASSGVSTPAAAPAPTAPVATGVSVSVTRMAGKGVTRLADAVALVPERAQFGKVDVLESRVLSGQRFLVVAADPVRTYMTVYVASPKGTVAVGFSAGASSLEQAQITRFANSVHGI